GGQSGSNSSNGNNAKNAHLSQDGTAAGSTGSSHKGHGFRFPWEPIGLALAALLAVAIIAPPASRFLVRQRRLAYADDLERAHAVWRETLDELADYHVARRPSGAPGAGAGRVSDDPARATPPAEALGGGALAEERASYADPPGTTPTRAD